MDFSRPQSLCNPFTLLGYRNELSPGVRVGFIENRQHLPGLGSTSSLALGDAGPHCEQMWFWGNLFLAACFGDGKSFVLAEQEVDLLADEQKENTWKGKEM